MNNISEMGSLDDLSVDESVDTSDIPEMTAEDLAKAEIRWPRHMAESVILDSTVLEWFKRHTGDYHDTINRILRDYMESHS